MIPLLQEALRAHKMYLLFGLFIVAGLLLALFVTSRSYPIALVNHAPISASRFWKNFRAASFYYQNVRKTYTIPEVEVVSPRAAELEANVLTQLVEATLIDQAVGKEVGGDLAMLLEAKIGRYEEDATFHRATRTLYGLEFDDFREEVLIPQAKRDILAGRLFLRGERFDDWLREAKRSASVFILSRGFRWDGEAVVAP